MTSPETPEAVDLLVRTNNPAALDRTVQALGPAAVVGGPDDFVLLEGCYVVRCFGRAGFIEYAINKQGYGEVVRRLDRLV
jgi:hypothetical protein